MEPDLVQQNNKEAAAFGSDFANEYSTARKGAAVDFGRQFQEGPSQAPVNDTPAKGMSFSDLGRGVVRSGEAAVSTSRGAGRDIGLGVIQAPRSAARGVIKGANSIMNFIDELNDWVPAPRLFDIDEETKEMKFKPGIRSENDLEAAWGREIGGGFIPVPGAPGAPTVTGKVIESIAQFAVGLKGVDKIGDLYNGGKAAATGVSKVLQNAGKGGAADVLAFDQHEERLSNVIQQVPALQNPVAEFLQARPDDNLAEGKLKQFIEGAGLNLAGDALIGGLKLLKKGRAAKAELEASGGSLDQLASLPAEEAAGVELTAKQFGFLGNPDAAERFTLKTKMEAAEEEVQGAFGKTKQISDKPAPGIDDYEINFSRIDAPDDIKQLMDEMVNNPALKISIEAERRGARDNRATLTAATDIDGFDSLMGRRTGDAFNAEQIVAGRKVYYDTTTKLMEAAKRASGPDATSIDQFNFRKMVAVHHAVQKEFMGIRAEAGRALQAWRIPVGGTGAENVRALEQVLTDFGGEGASKELARRLSELGNTMNTSQINAITQKAAGARTMDAVTEAWTLGLLTNPTTHVVNLGSNVLTSLTLGMERMGMAAVADSPVTFREGAEFFTAMLETQRLAIKNMAQAFRTGETGMGLGKLDGPRTRATARDILDPEGKAGIFSKALDGWGAILNKYVGGALAAGDEYNKTILYQAQMRSLAVRRGVAQGMEGDALKKYVADMLLDPPASMRADATTFANYGTFTKQLGKTGQDVQRIIARHPALRFVAPFVRTPANIFKFTFERTPLALLSSQIRADLGAGGVRRATALTRIGMGTSVMALGADMALNGKITGSGPSDPGERSALRRTGWQPYSVKIGEAHYSYQRFEPFATWLGMSADIGEILSNYEAYDINSQTEADELVTAAIIAAGNQVTGKTFMSGFADLTEALSDPKRYGQSFVNRLAGSVVPAGVAGIERAIDPGTAQVYSIRDAILSRIPGASAAAAPRLNVWGEEIKMFYPSEDNIAAASAQRVMSLFNPVYVSREKKDAVVDQWLLKNGFNIDMPDKTQTFEGVKIDLRGHPEIYTRLVQLRGNELKLAKYGNQGMQDFFRNLVNENDPLGRHMSFFMKMGNDFDDQKNFIQGVVSHYQAAAKQQLIEDYPEIMDIVAKERRNAEALNGVRQSIKQAQEAIAP